MRLTSLMNLTPEEWIASFEAIEKHVNYLLAQPKDELDSNVLYLATTLLYPTILKSFCEFCSGNEIDDHIRKIVSNLIILFSDVAIKLNGPNSQDLSKSLISLAKDITLASNKDNLNFEPIKSLGIEGGEYFRNLSE